MQMFGMYECHIKDKTLKNDSIDFNNKTYD
jgi:hypothetical protein